MLSKDQELEFHSYSPTTVHSNLSPKVPLGKSIEWLLSIFGLYKFSSTSISDSVFSQNLGT